LPLATTGASAKIETIMGVLSTKEPILTDEVEISEIEDNGRVDPLEGLPSLVFVMGCAG